MLVSRATVHRLALGHTAAAVLSLLLVAGCASVVSHAEWSPMKPERLVYLGSAVGEAAVTHEVTSRPGFREGHPVVRAVCGDNPSLGCHLGLILGITYPALVMVEGAVRSAQESKLLPTPVKWVIWGAASLINFLLMGVNMSLVW